ncbi:MAG: hypothetical protein MZV64_49610 [Ignavibacteriales bacterium]|nr:hypothetical protein [Ignavibacteriales bacterium]
MSAPWSCMRVGPDLVGQADAAALLVEDVEDDAAALAARSSPWRPASCSPQSQRGGAEGVAGQALRVDPDQDRLVAADVALDQGDVVLAAGCVSSKAWMRKSPQRGRQVGLVDLARPVRLVLHAVA